MIETTQNQTQANQENSLEKNLAATTIQATARGFLARRRYCIREIEMFELEKYPAFVVGNDPCMPATLSNHAEPHEKIALVGTSCIRNISIACELGQSLQHTPKIFIVDNSFEVHQFWRQFRAFMQDDALSKTHALFSANLADFLEKTNDLCRQPSNKLLKGAWGDSVTFPDQNSANFMQSIIDKHGYERFRAVVSHVSLIKQSWEDTQTFIKLRNIIKLLGIQTIYTYPSNIVTLMYDHLVEETILKNIHLLSPKLSIHVINGFTPDRYIAPKEVKLIEDNHPKEASIALGLN